MITLTPKAIEKIKEISEVEEIGHTSVRIKINGGGCSGFVFDLYYDDIINDMDEVLNMNGIQLVIDSLSYQYMDDIIINYLDTTFGGGFKFSGGSIKSQCGCGNSVGF